ncbi:myosin heavy chain, muscle-like [Homarus americanus]|uniref:myosin heavy chain, muscle-like n=1 Tax=Homarus americanus TaxID=6706 RepID=UPI001C492BE0|nr:myosin heavy chain, muscle-like [Homarus americanus]XP_042217778.1 myosin heavy chain, muscle-like [Homarus americanus]
MNSRIVSLRRGVEELESRVTCLEEQVDQEALLGVEAHHVLKNANRHAQELTFQAEEDRNNTTRMMERVAHLQDQLKTYAAHLEDAKQVADANLAKYKQAERARDLAKDLSSIREERAKTASRRE